MITTARLLNEYAKKHGLETPYQIAKKLGLSSPTIYRVLNEGKTLQNKDIVKIAEDLGMDWHKALASIEAERAKSADEKRFWMKHAGFANVAHLSVVAGFSAFALFPSITSGALTIVYTLCVYWMDQGRAQGGRRTCSPAP